MRAFGTKDISLTVFLACLALTLQSAPLPVYLVPVKVQCATPEAAVRAQLTLLPLPEGRQVAFSCRWDDSTPRHLVMRKLLEKHGYRATFYLTESGRKDFWQDVVPALHSDGFTVGNHTRSHLELPLLTPNGIHNEILGWSIILETRCNQPVNAFVLPYGKCVSPFFPDASQTIASCLQRAGLLGGVDLSARMMQLLQLPTDEYFYPRHVRPGDKNTSPEKFDQDVATALASPKRPVHLALGVHAWHSDEDLLKLEESLKKYAHRPDWWYCNENEYLAYRYMFLHSRVVDKRVTGSAAEFTVELPCPEVLGSDTPLWAECDGKRIPVPHTRKIPSRIGIAAPDGKCARFPGLVAKLARTSEDHIQLELVNTGDAVENLMVTLRLPPDCQSQVLHRSLPDFSGKATLDWDVIRSPSADATGKRLTACQIDFTRKGVQGRIWVTLREEIPVAKTQAVQVRYASEAFSEEERVTLAKPDTALPSAFVPAVHAPNYREGVYLVRLPRQLTLQDTLLATMDFQGGRQMRLRGNLPGPILFNGQLVSAKDDTLLLEAPAGACRLLLVYPPAKRVPREIILVAE